MTVQETQADQSKRTGQGTQTDQVDVVVVGGGIAGSAVAAQLARGGHSVVVLEREETYTDRVRGEGMVHWGLEAAQQMGLDQAILDAPGLSIMTKLVTYDELLTVEQAQRRSRSLVDMIPGVPGLVALGHPEMRQAIVDVAESRGATILRGVSDVLVTPGKTPQVSFEHNDKRHLLKCRTVVAADGKESSVRRSLSIEMQATTPTMMLTGMLVDDGGAWDRNEVTIGVHGENQLYVFPREGALRLYTGRMVGSDKYVGPNRQQLVLDSFNVPSLPHAEALSQAEPIGPCATFPMTDSWTRHPYAQGVVLLGDAAGWSNPVTGQGLAVAMRDAKVLSELMLNEANWDEALFEQYAAERYDRMRRLRFASALTDMMMAQGAPDRADRRKRMQSKIRNQPELLKALDATHVGPWRVAEAAFEPSILTALAA